MTESMQINLPALMELDQIFWCSMGYISPSDRRSLWKADRFVAILRPSSFNHTNQAIVQMASDDWALVREALGFMGCYVGAEIKRVQEEKKISKEVRNIALNHIYGGDGTEFKNECAKKFVRSKKARRRLKRKKFPKGRV